MVRYRRTSQDLPKTDDDFKVSDNHENLVGLSTDAGTRTRLRPSGTMGSFMTTGKNIGIGLLLLGAMCLVGCGKKTEQTLPGHAGSNFGSDSSQPEFPLPVPSHDALETPDDETSQQQNDSPPIEAVKMRFEPSRRLSRSIVLAEQERTRTGFQPGDDFSLEAAIQMGQLLRKEWPPLPPLDERALRSQGIRILKGKHLTLCTDLPPSPEINNLPNVFDLAVAEYCRFFGVDPKHCAAWQMRGCLIDDLETFRAADLLGPFPTDLIGYSVDDRLWVREQKSDYFRRHLILHEGVHGFMNDLFGACGPEWYMESSAEYLATHRWENGRLELGVLPEHTDDLPGWRRIEMLKGDIKAGNMKTVDRILRSSVRQPARQGEPPVDYACVWAFGYLLDRHPQYRDAYRDMARWLTFRDFSNRFYLRLADRWNELQIDWLCLLDELDYGYDVPRMVLDPQPGKALVSSMTFEVDASRGWQNAGVALEADKTYRISASGRYRLGDNPKAWFAEPNGVTLRYHKGQALGLLLGAVVPDGLFDAEDEIAPEDLPFLSPMLIGTERELTPERSGTLYLRVNDSPAELGDNEGSCRVVVEAPLPQGISSY